MRLYRGLKNVYRPELVDDSWHAGTDFTDCPAAALLYAQSSRGVLIVIDIEHDPLTVPQRVREASWQDVGGRVKPQNSGPARSTRQLRAAS
jgi:hypothetical protein